MKAILNYELFIVNYQLSIVNCELSLVIYYTPNC